MTTPPRRAAAGEGDTVSGYRPVSAIAVGAAAIGLASMLALLSPALWVLPLVGIAVSIAALVDVGRRDAPKAGRLAALAGLGLSLGFGAQALAAAGTAEWLARGRAEAAVRFWLDAIAAGRLDDARSMCAADAAGSVDSLAAAGASAAPRVRARGRDATTGARVVRVVTGAASFDLALESAPARRDASAERLTIVRCDPVTPIAR
ncbi:MAG: hypothetical protein ACKOSQ_06585 [Planctomycetaceae bacterium]